MDHFFALYNKIRTKSPIRLTFYARFKKEPLSPMAGSSTRENTPLCILPANQLLLSALTNSNMSSSSNDSCSILKIRKYHLDKSKMISRLSIPRMLEKAFFRYEVKSETAWYSCRNTVQKNTKMKWSSSPWLLQTNLRQHYILSISIKKIQTFPQSACRTKLALLATVIPHRIIILQ